jgi:hypothetical protein
MIARIVAPLIPLAAAVGALLAGHFIAFAVLAILTATTLHTVIVDGAVK